MMKLIFGMQITIEVDNLQVDAIILGVRIQACPEYPK